MTEGDCCQFLLESAHNLFICKGNPSFTLFQSKKQFSNHKDFKQDCFVEKHKKILKN